MRWVLVLSLLAACGGPSTRPAAPGLPPDAPPATRWILPEQPWRISDGAGGIVIAGNVALVAGASRGAIEEIDLSTGERLREHALGKRIGITTFERMADGRYLVAGEHDNVSEVAIVDPTTFAPTWFTLDRVAVNKEAYATAGAIQLADGSIAICGPDLTLGIYDPTTRTRLRQLSDQPSWTNLRATATTLWADAPNGDVVFDLATGAAKPGDSTSVIATTREARLERSYVKGLPAYRVITAAGVLELPATLGFSVALDDDASRVASARNGVVSVYATATGAVTASFDLAPQTGGVTLVFVGDRLVVATSTTLRVADLARKTITAPREPYGPYGQLAVDDAGAITAIGAEAWRFVDGALASTASLGKQTVLVQARSADRFATRTQRPLDPLNRTTKFPSIIVVKTIEGRTVRHVSLPRETGAAWLGDDGRMIAAYRWSAGSMPALVEIASGAPRSIVEYNLDAVLEDVSVEDNLAAFTLGGTVTVLDTKTGAKTTLRIPHCEEYAPVALERRGTRAVAFDAGEVLVWDRVTGSVLASAHIADLEDVQFLPGESTLLVHLPERIGWWDPATGALRSVAIPGLARIAISPNRAHAVIALGDGRLALVDYAALRARAEPGPAVEAGREVPASCSARDPFDLRDPAEEPEPEVEDPEGEAEDDEDTGD